jgi:hypothetical protein
MVFTLIPRSDNVSTKVVASTDFEKYFSQDIVNDYVKSGLTMAAGSGLAVTITAGIARIKGLYVESTGTETVSSLTASDVNYIYASVSRDGCSEPQSWSFTKNLTGVVPADSLLIGTATTDGSSVTATDITTRVTNTLNLINGQIFPCNTQSESHLKISNTPINCYFLSAQSGDTGGLTWAKVVLPAQVAPRDGSDVNATGSLLMPHDTVLGNYCPATAVVEITTIVSNDTGSDTGSSENLSSDSSCYELPQTGPGHIGTSTDYTEFGRTFIRDDHGPIDVTSIRLKDVQTLSDGPPYASGNAWYKFYDNTGTLVHTETFTMSGSGGWTSQVDRDMAICDTVWYMTRATQNSSSASSNHFMHNKFQTLGVADIHEGDAKLLDNNTATVINTLSAANNWITYDFGGSSTFGSVAIYLHSDTTETELKIRLSTSSNMDDTHTKRTILVSSMTTGAWNYIRINPYNSRYIQIYGSSGAAGVLSIPAIKAKIGITDSEQSVGHGHMAISTTDTSLALDGT